MCILISGGPQAGQQALVVSAEQSTRPERSASSCVDVLGLHVPVEVLAVQLDCHLATTCAGLADLLSCKHSHDW